ncbi:MAG: hypothetical protein NXI28_11495 [bacterium]|nr:hypothetical protein [bacterium]
MNDCRSTLFACVWFRGRALRAASHARPPPSRTPERRRSSSPKNSFRERFLNADTRQNAAPETAQP